MNSYTAQLKESIREKLNLIDDAEYLSSLDAILTYETYGNPELNAKQNAVPEKKTSLWKKLGFI